MASVGPSPASEVFGIDVRDLSQLWEKEHVSPPDPHSMKHAELVSRLTNITSQYQNLVRMQQVGDSVEGRAIYLIHVGTGPKNILLWSQMHGDEPTATSAMLDLLHFFGRHRQEPWAAEILQKYTLLCIPMLNPDGAEKNQRRNAQHLDINRDALMLQSPEGRILKEVRDKYKPILGFNLHNQNSLTTVGDTGRVATIALLAVGADQPASPNQARVETPLASTESPSIPMPLSKQVAAVLYEALSPFIYGHISRYDESYNPRAFGDNLARWGTPVVLIESGGLPADSPPNLTVKLNFIGSLAALNSMASGKIANANPAAYDALKVNSENPIFDLLLQNAWIFTGTGVPLFRGDVAIRHEVRAGRKDESIIADLGDLRISSAHRTIDCTDALITPGLIGYERGGSGFASNQKDSEYLRAGILTLLGDADWKQIIRSSPDTEAWGKKPRSLNWGFVLAGDPDREDLTSVMKLAEWLAAGGRAWARTSVRPLENYPQLSKIADWFGVEILSTDEARKFTIPSAPDFRGKPERLLPRWTSEAARRFRLPGRGVITSGAVADLVIWRASTPGEPVELSNYRPSHAVLNGRMLDLGSSDAPAFGRFLGR
jgi:hypothetical protein